MREFLSRVRAFSVFYLARALDIELFEARLQSNFICQSRSKDFPAGNEFEAGIRSVNVIAQRVRSKTNQHQHRVRERIGNAAGNW